MQRVEIVIGDDLRLNPSLVRARPGVIELTFRNVGLTPHDLTVAAAADSAGAALADSGNVNGGATSVVTVTVDTPGRYPMPCLYHLTSGMRGTLDVR